MTGEPPDGRDTRPAAGDTNPVGLDASVLCELLGFQLRRAQQKLFQHFKDTVGALGVTPGQAGVLMLVRNNPGISQAALARAVGVERATLGEAIDYLAGCGWIRRRRADNDRRSYALDLSPSGRAFMRKLIPAIHAHERAVSANLSAGDGRRLRALLTKFTDGA